MKVVGITGGVGSGKSYVIRLLKERYNGAVILADLVAHDLMEPGRINYLKIVECFGKQILTEDKTIDRGVLANLIFSDEDKLKTLNSIVHPNVKEEIEHRIQVIQDENKADFIALEAALLIEGNYDTIYDELWYIYADKETRLKRLCNTRGYSMEKSLSIMDKQLSEEVYRNVADKVIDNSKDESHLITQLDQIVGMCYNQI